MEALRYKCPPSWVGPLPDSRPPAVLRDWVLDPEEKDPFREGGIHPESPKSWWEFHRSDILHSNWENNFIPASYPSGMKRAHRKAKGGGDGRGAARCCRFFSTVLNWSVEDTFGEQQWKMLAGRSDTLV